MTLPYITPENFAAEAHSDQLRKYTNEPYVNHCRNVAELVKRYGGTPDMITAAWLHDVVEDTHVTVGDVCSRFGENVARYVDQLTDISRPHHGNRVKRKSIDIAHLSRAEPVVKTIKLCDLLDNTSSIVRHDPKFAVIFLAEKQLMLVYLSDASNQELYALVERELFKTKYKLTNIQLTAFDKHFDALVKAMGEL